jgi:N-acyl homoserine lactone hydrolase
MKGNDFELREGDCELEDGVKILFTPGHTAEGQSVAVSTARGAAIIEECAA